MPDRTSTILRENAIDSGKYIQTLAEKKNTQNETEAIQNRILYEDKPELFGTCIICDKKADNRSDHLISAIFKKNARFRDGKILATEHPLNKVYCCTGKCNNETNKAKAMLLKPRLKAYADYVLENIPTNNITEAQFAILNQECIDAEKRRIAHVRLLLQGPPEPPSHSEMPQASAT
jgi:hypothetical protein